MNRTSTKELTAEQQEIVRQLGSKYASERLSAEKTLQDMGEAAVPILRHVLRKPLETVRWGEKFLFGIWLCISVCYPLYLLAQGHIHLPNSVIEGIWFLVGMLGSMIFTGILAMMFIALPLWLTLMGYVSFHGLGPAQEAAFRVMTNTKDVWAVGPLAETARWLREGNHKPREAAIREALLLLLPKMQRADYLALTATQKQCLHALLRECSTFIWARGGEDDPPTGCPRKAYDYHLSVTLLQFYARMGDRSVIRNIQRLVRAKPAEDTLDAQTVRENAIAALEGIENHGAEWDTATTHLRASSAPEAPSEELLIPASRGDDTPPEELLRAENQEKQL
jgi:hypothetical protein